MLVLLIRWSGENKRQSDSEKIVMFQKFLSLLRSLYDMGLKPGEKAPDSEQYEIMGPHGGRTGNERTVTSGEPLLLSPKP